MTDEELADALTILVENVELVEGLVEDLVTSGAADGLGRRRVQGFVGGSRLYLHKAASYLREGASIIGDHPYVTALRRREGAR